MSFFLCAIIIWFSKKKIHNCRFSHTMMKYQKVHKIIKIILWVYPVVVEFLSRQTQKMSSKVVSLWQSLWNKKKNNSNNNTDGEKLSLLESQDGNIQGGDATVVSEKPKKPTTERMIALDVMRGMTIMLMIVVNNQPGDTFTLLEHAEWFGMTPT